MTFATERAMPPNPHGLPRVDPHPRRSGRDRDVLCFSETSTGPLSSYSSVRWRGWVSSRSAPSRLRECRRARCAQGRGTPCSLRSQGSLQLRMGAHRFPCASLCAMTCAKRDRRGGGMPLAGSLQTRDEHEDSNVRLDSLPSSLRSFPPRGRLLRCRHLHTPARAMLDHGVQNRPQLVHTGHSRYKACSSDLCACGRAPPYARFFRCPG
jgi:hypothetical protein